MTFKQATQATATIATAWCAGLGALRAADRAHIAANDTRRLCGSVDLDTTLRPHFPSDPRWDYAVGHQPTNKKDETVYWVGIHPASSDEVNVVLAKLDWLRTWLATAAPKLNKQRSVFVWVSSGKTSFTQNSLQAKRLALRGLKHTGRVLEIPDIIED